MKLAATISLIAATLLAGCAGSQNTTPPPQAAPTEPAFRAPDDGESITPARLIAESPATTTFKAMGEEPGTQTITRHAPTRTVAHVVQTGSARPREREVTLVTTDDGSLAISRETNRAERVIVEFQPPLVVYPATIRAGEPLVQKLRMIVHPINDPSRIQNQGDATHTVTFEGHERIDTPLGPIETLKLTAILEADLGGPQVRNETQEWLSPDRGVVAMKQLERTTMLGIRVRNNSEWWVLERASP